jgi:hypothetical protein
MAPTATLGIPGNYPGQHIGKMSHALRQQFRLDVTGPWNIGENLRYGRPGNPIPPTDLGLRCPCLITLRHVVLHRVEWSNFGPDVAFACTLLSDFTLGSASKQDAGCSDRSAMGSNAVNLRVSITCPLNPRKRLCRPDSGRSGPINRNSAPQQNWSVFCDRSKLARS